MTVVSRTEGSEASHLATPAVPVWLAALNEQDLQFLKRFLLSSGSLKDMAKQYSVSYPTVRSRLDRLIAKAKAADAPQPTDPFERLLQVLVADAALSPALAKDLLAAHRQSSKQEKRK